MNLNLRFLNTIPSLGFRTNSTDLRDNPDAFTNHQFIPPGAQGKEINDRTAGLNFARGDGSDASTRQQPPARNGHLEQPTGCLRTGLDRLAYANNSGTGKRVLYFPKAALDRRQRRRRGTVTMTAQGEDRMHVDGQVRAGGADPARSDQKLKRWVSKMAAVMASLLPCCTMGLLAASFRYSS